MNEKFFDLPQEKQDRMINAILKVFAMQGYRHASTDEMVKEAGISKGLLFHYFESKIGAYAFAYDYSVRFMQLELRTCVDPFTADLFELMKQLERGRMQAMRVYPYMQQFLNRAAGEKEPEALLATEVQRTDWQESCEKWFRQVNTAGLPQGINVRKLRKMMELAIRGLMTEQFENDSFHPDMLYLEICEYLDMMRYIVSR